MLKATHLQSDGDELKLSPVTSHLVFVPSVCCELTLVKAQKPRGLVLCETHLPEPCI